MSEAFDQAHASLERVQTFNVKHLSRKEELGTEFAFDDAIDPAAKVVSLFRQISLDHLDEFADRQLKLIQQQADSFYNMLNDILNFNPGQIDQNPKGQRDNLVNVISASHQSIFDQLFPLISFAASRIRDFAALETEARAAIQSIQDRTAEVTADLKEHEKTARDTLEEVRKVAAEQGVSQQAIHFKEESDKHEKLARKWRDYTVKTGIGLGLYALATAFAHKWPWLAPATSYETVQLAVSKILIFVVIAYMLVLCARNFLSHTHNEIVNRQRQNALMTFQALADAARNEDSKDVVLTHAAACIFSPQETGYAKPGIPASTGATPSVLRILQHLTRSGPEGSQ